MTTTQTTQDLGGPAAPETMRLIIKGSPEDATRAAQARGIAITLIEELHTGTPWTQTLVRCDIKHERLVIAWFKEPPPPPATGHAFPLGSLLLYAYDDASALALSKTLTVHL